MGSRNLLDGTYHGVSQVPVMCQPIRPIGKAQGTHRHLSQVSSENTCNVVRRILFLFPIEVFSVLGCL